MISDLESVNSAYHKDQVCNCNIQDPNFYIDFKPFDLAHPEVITFEYDLRTSSSLE